MKFTKCLLRYTLSMPFSFFAWRGPEEPELEKLEDDG